MSEQNGKNISDPGQGEAEVRGGEKPADWRGPLPSLPEKVPPQDEAQEEDSGYEYVHVEDAP